MWRVFELMKMTWMRWETTGLLPVFTREVAYLKQRKHGMAPPSSDVSSEPRESTQGVQLESGVYLRVDGRGGLFVAILNLDIYSEIWKFSFDFEAV